MNILILTALPFRKQGNQSLYRFVEMFLKTHDSVELLSSGSDCRGEVVFDHKLLRTTRIKSFDSLVWGFVKRIFSKSNRQHINHNPYLNVKSNDVFLPFVTNGTKACVAKYFRLLVKLIDNCLLFFYVLIFKRSLCRDVDVIIAYERAYTFCARALSKSFKKKYVNKFQGTLLNATHGDVYKILKYYPYEYFSVNKADLTIMVNDGTNGAYYAKMRGCNNILFQPHGVPVINERNKVNSILSDKRSMVQDKFLIFNNASGSKWKRVDRIVRILSHVNQSVLNKLIVLTTYYGDDLNYVKDLSMKLNVSESIIFYDKMNFLDSHMVLRQSRLVLSTNDLSNLGNPVLESIFYKIPVLSIDDGSLNGFITHDHDGVVLPLDESFDEKAASYIERMILDETYYHKLKNNLLNNHSVKSLETQQMNEYSAISLCCYGKKLF